MGSRAEPSRSGALYAKKSAAGAGCGAAGSGVRTRSTAVMLGRVLDASEAHLDLGGAGLVGVAGVVIRARAGRAAAVVVAVVLVPGVVVAVIGLHIHRRCEEEAVGGGSLDAGVLDDA